LDRCWHVATSNASQHTPAVLYCTCLCSLHLRLHYVSFEAKHWRASGYMNTEISSPRVSFLIIFPSFTFSLSLPLGLTERTPLPFPDKAKKRLILSVGFQFPSRALLHQWGKDYSPKCPFCHERESQGRIRAAVSPWKSLALWIAT
jgi:hypothetical protein